MKKILIILGTISLITSGSNNLIACDNNNFLKKLSPEEIEKLKKENSKIIKGNKLEWIAPQENVETTHILYFCGIYIFTK
ncbi:MAG: lipoprotein [Spiroplasma sp. hy2]|uniref:lipoprotein n=1 Tax=Spiroplasma sp. hy2 TaxID=2490850 RepID=UPI0038430A92